MKSVWRWCVASFELARIAVAGGYRPGSRYWAWRRETAFGGPRRLRASERRAALYHFALWSRRMRRFTNDG